MLSNFLASELRNVIHSNVNHNNNIITIYIHIYKSYVSCSLARFDELAKKIVHMSLLQGSTFSRTTFLFATYDITVTIGYE